MKRKMTNYEFLMSYSPPLSASQITEISQKITDLINTAITTATANAKALLNEQLEATVKRIGCSKNRRHHPSVMVQL